jgi:hypothetical protein
MGAAMSSSVAPKASAKFALKKTCNSLNQYLSSSSPNGTAPVYQYVFPSSSVTVDPSMRVLGGKSLEGGDPFLEDDDDAEWGFGVFVAGVVAEAGVGGVVDGSDDFFADEDGDLGDGLEDDFLATGEVGLCLLEDSGAAFSPPLLPRCPFLGVLVVVVAAT